MRIIVKCKNEIRIYNGDHDFQSLSKFVNQQFYQSENCQNKKILQGQKGDMKFTYIDEEGDNIMIQHQLDFENFLVMVSHKSYIKLQAFKEHSSNKSQCQQQSQVINNAKQEFNTDEYLLPQKLSEVESDSQVLIKKEETQRLQTQQQKLQYTENQKQALIQDKQRPQTQEVFTYRQFKNQDQIVGQKKGFSSVFKQQQSSNLTRKVSTEERQKNIKALKKKVSVSKPNQMKKGKQDIKMVNLDKIANLIEKKIQQIVDEKVKHLIPCIKKQIFGNNKEEVNQQKNEQKKQKLVHAGYTCKGCCKQPIVGVRYECSTCKNFNLCQACQAQIQHDHSLLKHKKIFDAQKIKIQKAQKIQKKKQHNQILQLSSKIISQLFKQAQNARNATQDPKLKAGKKKQDLKAQKQKQIQAKIQQKKAIETQKQQKKKVAEAQKQRIKNVKKLQKQELAKKKLESQKKIKIDRRCERLGKVFQKPKKSFEQFVQKTMDMELNKAIQLYSQQNNIDLNQKAILKQEKMVKRIGDYFNKDAQQYRTIVIRYPSVPFYDLLKIMKQEGVQDYTDPKYKQKRVKLMRDQEVKIETPLGEIQKYDQSSQWIDFPTKERSNNYKEKGKILLKMKQLFGEKESKQYFVFIEKNFQLGQQKIIEAWKQSRIEMIS